MVSPQLRLLHTLLSLLVGLALQAPPDFTGKIPKVLCESWDKGGRG